MLYDMKMHMPQLMDKTLEAFTNGELEKLYRLKTVICKTMDDTDINSKMDLIEAEKERQRKKTIDKTLGELKKLSSVSNIETAYVTCQQLWENHMKQFDIIESNYWETVISKIKETMKNLESFERA